jgi:hypothetical protein
MSRLALAGLAALVVWLPAASFGLERNDADAASPLELFEQRIMPIFKSPRPASCVQCHLAAVDLKDYIQPSHEQTFASLRDQGLIDLEAPENSKILKLIRMGEADSDQRARLIHEPMRKAEYEAFAAWITASCQDPTLRDMPQLTGPELARPARPDAVIRHARKSRVVDSFVRNVWSQRMRCFPCHTPHELDETNPKHRLAIQRYRDFQEKYGGQLGERMYIFRETPETTLQSLIEKSRQTPIKQLSLIDLKNPRKSLLVLKPTSKLPKKNEDGTFAPPSYTEPVSHMGGLKMHVDDPSYKAFIAWIQDYARVVGDRYAGVDELPVDNWHASQHVVLLQDAPESWPESLRIQFFIHAWDAQQESWSEEPIAFTQNSLTPRRIVGGPLFLLRAAGSQEDHDWDTEDGQLAPGT